MIDLRFTEDCDDLEIELLLRGCKSAEQLQKRLKLSQQFDELMSGEEPDEE